MVIPFRLRKIPKIENLTKLKNMPYERIGVYSNDRVLVASVALFLTSNYSAPPNLMVVLNLIAS